MRYLVCVCVWLASVYFHSTCPLTTDHWSLTTGERLVYHFVSSLVAANWQWDGAHIYCASKHSCIYYVLVETLFKSHSNQQQQQLTWTFPYCYILFHHCIVALSLSLTIYIITFKPPHSMLDHCAFAVDLADRSANQSTASFAGHALLQVSLWRKNRNASTTNLHRPVMCHTEDIATRRNPTGQR